MKSSPTPTTLKSKVSAQDAAKVAETTTSWLSRTASISSSKDMFRICQWSTLRDSRVSTTRPSSRSWTSAKRMESNWIDCWTTTPGKLCWRKECWSKSQRTDCMSLLLKLCNKSAQGSRYSRFTETSRPREVASLNASSTFTWRLPLQTWVMLAKIDFLFSVKVITTRFWLRSQSKDTWSPGIPSQVWTKKLRNWYIPWNTVILMTWISRARLVPRSTFSKECSSNSTILTKMTTMNLNAVFYQCQPTLESKSDRFYSLKI